MVLSDTRGDYWRSSYLFTCLGYKRAVNACIVSTQEGQREAIFSLFRIKPLSVTMLLYLHGTVDEEERYAFLTRVQGRMQQLGHVRPFSVVGWCSDDPCLGRFRARANVKLHIYMKPVTSWLDLLRKMPPKARDMIYA